MRATVDSDYFFHPKRDEYRRIALDLIYERAVNPYKHSPFSDRATVSLEYAEKLASETLEDKLNDAVRKADLGLGHTVAGEPSLVRERQVLRMIRLYPVYNQFYKTEVGMGQDPADAHRIAMKATNGHEDAPSDPDMRELCDLAFARLSQKGVEPSFKPDEMGKEQLQ